MKRNHLVILALIAIVGVLGICYAARPPLHPEAPVQPPAAEGRPPAPN